MAGTKRARDIFLEALDQAPVDRAAYLDEACGDDAALRQRVEALLRAHDDPGAFLSEAKPGASDAALPPVAGGATVGSEVGQPQTEAYSDPTARVGAILAGKYKLVEEIGAGGMGSVFMARQTEPVKRAVAVKVIKAGMDSKEVLARFEAERQALAMMDHPNIARVLDAGTTAGGRPFFVMELVKGTPITRYCDEHKLTPRQRLELFVPVCQAIQHAHQKGIIHRDIKPSNVLVALYDDRPVPKVIDFGVAKAAGQALTDKSLMTGFGAMVGTPEYMSPEQASLNNLDIDTRSDVYSLGVILYELLTGTTPVDRKSLGQAALLEILRMVREVEAPRPSAKLSTIDTLPSVAANRGTEPARLSRLMKGELDWLVLKALEKDRTRRYDTANGLARDIQRYLADEVVEARPPSVGYRLSKFVRRHKGQVIAASLVLLALVGGVVGTTLGLFEARRQEKIARDETGKKENALLAETEARAGLVQANDNLLDVGARGLLRPLQPSQGPLNDQEVQALWELAIATDEGLRLRFVELALDDPALRQRLKDRAPFAFQAAIGLDRARRKRVEELLGKRLETKGTSPEEQEQVAFCLAHLGGLERRLAGKTADALIQAMNQTTGPNALRSLAQALSAVSARLEPKEASQRGGRAAATLIQVMSKTKDAKGYYYARDLHYLAEGLSAVAAHLEAKEASQQCGQAAAILTQAVRKKNPFDQGGGVGGLYEHLAMALSAVAARLAPKEAAEVAAALTQAMVDAARSGPRPEPYRLGCLAQALSAVAARLEAKEAAQRCGPAAATLIQAMSKPWRQDALGNLAQGLSAVAARLEAKEAAQRCGPAAATLIQAMSKTTSSYSLQNLAQGLSAVAAHLERKDASQRCGQAAATLIQCKTTSEDREAYPLYVAEGLSALAVRLEAKEAAEVAAALTEAMSKTTDPEALQNLAQGLSAVAPRLEQKDASQLCGQAVDTLTQSISKGTYPAALQSVAQAVSALSGRLEPEEAAATLTQAMSKTMDLNALANLQPGLSAVLVRLDSKEATQVWGQAAATLTQALALLKSWDPNAWPSLAQSLSAVLARELPPQTLVDLLKHPCCVGKLRRLVLDQLARHYNRPLADQWDFVDYVHEHNLGLDLTTPPARSSMLP